MSGVQRIMAAAAECARPDELIGPAKIMAAAGEAGCPRPGDKAGVRKIMAAAAEAKTPNATDGPDRIRRAAGKAGRAEEQMAKALSDLDTLESQMRPSPPPPPRRSLKPRPSRIAKLLAKRDFAPTPPGAFHRPAKQPSRPRPLPFHHPLAYWNFVDGLAGDIRRGDVHPTHRELVDHTERHYAVDRNEATEWVCRFQLRLLGRDLPWQERIHH
jgi:hypothetical protein